MRYIARGVCMARPQEFEYDQVLNSAMQLFWRKGYASTSIKDLTEVTKLQPGSLYGTFKNKRSLFLQSLDFYFLNLYTSIKKILHSKKAPLERIYDFFDYFITQAESDIDRKSCLLVNTLLEIPAEDEKINMLVREMFYKIENEFSIVLSEAKDKGNLKKGTDTDALAKMLMSGIFGLQVYNKMQPDKQGLKKIIQSLLSTLKN